MSSESALVCHGPKIQYQPAISALPAHYCAVFDIQGQDRASYRSRQVLLRA